MPSPDGFFSNRDCGRAAKKYAPQTWLREWRDLAGALHIHSTYSDGASDVPTVMEAAKEVGVDFLLLTDHNTQQPLRDGWEARYEEKPLLLIGTEVTVEQGAFLLALDMSPNWEPTRYQPPQLSPWRRLTGTAACRWFRCPSM